MTELEQNIDLKDLKKQKMKVKKIFKKAIKQYDLNKIQDCLKFITTYDEVAHQYKYEKYYNMLSPQIKEALRVREEISGLKDFDTSIYDLFEKKLVSRMTKHINQHTEKRLHQIKVELAGHKQQLANKNLKRVRRTK